MDYKFLVSKEVEKFFDETNFSVGEILLSILQEKFTGIKIENKQRFLEMSDQDWYSVLEKVYAYHKEDE